MLSLDPRDLMREIRASAKARDTRREGIRAMLDKFPGSWWNGVQQDAEFDPENAGFEFVSYLATQLVWANPRVNVTTRRPVAQQEVAEAMQFGMNRWIVDSDFKSTLTDFVVDYLYGWSVALCTLVPRPEAYEAEDPPLWPQVTRVSPERCGWDHLCATPRQARIIWHEWWADKDDMLDRADRDKKIPEIRREGWDSAAIEGMQTSSAGISILGAMIRDRDETSVDRKQLRFVSVYLPGQQLDGEPGPNEGFNGTTIVLGCSPSGNGSASDGVIVCPPKPMFGPRWGRYVIGGTYPVPDSPHPLSPILANAGHIDLCTRTGKAISKAIQDYANFVVTSDATLAEHIVNGKHNGVYLASSVADLTGKLVQMTKGGPTQQMLIASELVNGRRDRSLGMDDVQRGVVTGEGTATEVAEASQAAGARVAQIKGGYQDFARRVLKTVAYDLFTTDEIAFPAGPEAGEAMRQRLAAQGIDVPEGHEPLFEGGSFEQGSGTTFDDLGLDIEPYSMERPSDQTKMRRAMFYTQVLPALAQVLPALVAQGWKPKPLLRAVGEAYEIPNLDDQVDVPSLLQAAKSPFPGEDPMPRLLRDIGAFKDQVGQLARPTPGRNGRLGPQRAAPISAIPMIQGAQPATEAASA